MELCDRDLQSLMKEHKFLEQDIKRLIYQLAHVMKYLQDHGIVHRDLKPSNILIKECPLTRKWIMKLADFGLARRHFTDTHSAMNSFVGTLTYMAPEVLRCWSDSGACYDKQVDIWSVGALLYNVIVGKCGFYASDIQDLISIIQHKGDAIAFKKINRNLVQYITELPADIDHCLSLSFKERINKLLRKLLKLDPQERITCEEFVAFADDLMKIRLVNVLHGTTLEVTLDFNMMPDHLVVEISKKMKISPQFLVFFTGAHLFCTTHHLITEEEFHTMLKHSNEKEGHPTLYVLDLKQLPEQVKLQDSGLFKQLSSLVRCEPPVCALNMSKHKYSEKIIKEIMTLEDRQQCQVTCVKHFITYIRQYVPPLRDWRDRALYFNAQVTQACNWLIAFANAVPNVFNSILQKLKICLKEVEGVGLGSPRSPSCHHLHQIQSFFDEIDNVLNTLLSFSSEELSTAVSKYNYSPLLEQAKQLAAIRQKGDMHQSCLTMLNDAKKKGESTVIVVQDALMKAWGLFESMWSLAKNLNCKCSEWEHWLHVASQGSEQMVANQRAEMDRKNQEIERLRAMLHNHNLGVREDAEEINCDVHMLSVYVEK